MSPATYDRRRLDRTGTGQRRTWTAEQKARIIAERYGSGEIVKVYKDHGFSGTKGVTSDLPSMHSARMPPSANSRC